MTQAIQVSPKQVLWEYDSGLRVKVLLSSRQPTYARFVAWYDEHYVNEAKRRICEHENERIEVSVSDDEELEPP